MNKEKNKSRFGNEIFGKVSKLTNEKCDTVEKCMNGLVKISEKKSILLLKALDLANELCTIDLNSLFEWADASIERLVESAEQGNWFESNKSIPILFILFSSSGTHRETRLSIICDYVLSKVLPSNEFELLDHIRICSLFINRIAERPDIYLSGIVNFLLRVLVKPDSLAFKVSKDTTQTCLRYIEKLKCLESFNESFPEIVSLIPHRTEFITLHESAEIMKTTRISHYMNKRVFPSMIQMLEPQLQYISKEKTEEEKMRKRLRKERSKTKRELLKESEARKIQKYQEMQDKKEKRQKARKEGLSILEQERTYTLDIAAAPAKNEEEDEKEAENVQNEPEESTDESSE